MHAGLRSNVENMDRLATEKRPSSREFRRRRQRVGTESGNHFRSFAVVGHHAMELTIVLPDVPPGRSGKSNSVRDQRVEHRLKLSR
jgi:hypothetical protein